MNLLEKLSRAAATLGVERGFELKNVLGNGAFKLAFLAEDKTRGRLVALKIAEAADSQRLEREVQALKSCNHRSVAQIIEAFPITFEATPMWVVLEEFLDGGTLEYWLGISTPEPAAVRNMGLSLAEVLGHLRDRALVHRDIKPANILFRVGNSDPVLTDFGLVRMLDAPSLTADFAMMGPGTPAYAAPEQLNNEKHLIDWRTDQFGLALVLGRCLLGRHPYQATPHVSIRDAILAVRDKAALPATSRHELEALRFGALVQALSPWPVSRFRRPEDLISALT